MPTQVLNRRNVLRQGAALGASMFGIAGLSSQASAMEELSDGNLPNNVVISDVNGERSDYVIRTEEKIKKGGKADSGDSASGSKAQGVVNSGTDSYRYAESVTSVEIPDKITFTHDKSNKTVTVSGAANSDTVYRLAVSGRFTQLVTRGQFNLAYENRSEGISVATSQAKNEIEQFSYTGELRSISVGRETEIRFRRLKDVNISFDPSDDSQLKTFAQRFDVLPRRYQRQLSLILDDNQKNALGDALKPTELVVDPLFVSTDSFSLFTTGDSLPEGSGSDGSPHIVQPDPGDSKRVSPAAKNSDITPSSSDVTTQASFRNAKTKAVGRLRSPFSLTTTAKFTLVAYWKYNGSRVKKGSVRGYSSTGNLGFYVRDKGTVARFDRYSPRVHERFRKRRFAFRAPGIGRIDTGTISIRLFLRRNGTAKKKVSSPFTRN